MNIDTSKQFEYENGFYHTATVARFATHLEFFQRTSNLAGSIVECGVFKGPSFCRFVKFRSLLENSHSRKIIGFNTL